MADSYSNSSLVLEADSLFRGELSEGLLLSFPGKQAHPAFAPLDLGSGSWARIRRCKHPLQCKHFEPQFSYQPGGNNDSCLIYLNKGQIKIKSVLVTINAHNMVYSLTQLYFILVFSFFVFVFWHSGVQNWVEQSMASHGKHNFFM